MGIGYRIKEARESLGLTQTELGKLVGVTGSAITNYENETSHPKEPIMYKLFDALRVDANYLFQDEMGSNYPMKVSYDEMEHIKKYRSLDDAGKKHIDYELSREVKRVEQIQSLESAHPAVIEFHSKTDDAKRLLEYFRSASAGTGVFILGNEASEQIAIPNTPENQYADFAIGVDGSSMEPDYHDGDIVLVSQKLELNYGDVGIFIINNKAYIKEYGETELISRNPAAENITISEYDNIVCMGKVIGKL